MWAQIASSVLGHSVRTDHRRALRHRAGASRCRHVRFAIRAARRERGQATPPKTVLVAGPRRRRRLCSRRRSTTSSCSTTVGSVSRGVPPTRCRGIGSPATRRRSRCSPRSTFDPTARSRSAATSPSSRSTPRPATSRLVQLVAVDDCGTVLNPMLAAGQVHGGIAQGVAHSAVRGSRLRRRRATRSPRASSTTRVPSAAELPSFDVHHTVTPRNPLGAKGIGESGTTGPPPPCGTRLSTPCRTVCTNSIRRSRRSGCGARSEGLDHVPVEVEFSAGS